MHTPYSIKIFLPGGDPDGIRIIKKSNWSGAGLVVPRAMMAKAKTQPELTRAGVYLLLAPPEVSGLPRARVGECSPIKSRLEQYASKRDFRTGCIEFTSKGTNLNKEHGRYIDALSIALPATVKQSTPGTYSHNTIFSTVH
jgi:hypothetical protein